MIYAPAQSQTQTPAALAVSEATAAFNCESETGSDATQHDAWLLSFIDILILLLALFVLLLTHQQDGTGGMGKAGQDTADQLMDIVAASEPFRLAFDLPVLLSAPHSVAELFKSEDELSAFSTQTVSEPEMPAAPATDNTVQTVEPLTTVDADSIDGTVDELQEAEPQPAALSNDIILTNPGPMEAFLDTLNNSALRDRVEVSVHGSGVNLEISDSILFTPANAALTADGMAVLEELADELKAQAYHLSIEGHTDNIPIETARFPSNWELSTARAAIVARHLVRRGISAERVRAIGYADTRPRAENLTPEGRSRNRRVSLILQARSGQN